MLNATTSSSSRLLLGRRHPSQLATLADVGVTTCSPTSRPPRCAPTRRAVPAFPRHPTDQIPASQAIEHAPSSRQPPTLRP